MRIIFIFIFIFFFNISFSQRTNYRLQKEMEPLLQSHKGVAGIFVYDLKRNRIVSINADTLFPTASMVKVPILIGIMNKIERGELQYHQSLTYKDSLLYAGSDILGSFKTNEKIELSKVIMLMLTTSDNTASLWLQSLAGGGSRINELMDSLGFVKTKVNSRTAGRENNRTEMGWGQTTPKEMVTLFKMIANENLLSTSLSQQMLRLLSRNYWDEQALSEIPAGVFVASKNGAVNASRSEVVYVNGKKSRYIFCICTKNNLDNSWENTNEAWQLTKKISALLWKTMN